MFGNNSDDSSDDDSRDKTHRFLHTYIQTLKKDTTFVEYCASRSREQVFRSLNLFIVKFECKSCHQIKCETRTEICDHTKCRKCKPECIKVCRQTLVDTLLYKRQSTVDKLKEDYEELGFTVTYIDKVVEKPNKKRKKSKK